MPPHPQAEIKIEIATEPLLVASTTTVVILGIKAIAREFGCKHPWLGAIALPLIGAVAFSAARQIKGGNANPRRGTGGTSHCRARKE